MRVPNVTRVVCNPLRLANKYLLLLIYKTKIMSSDVTMKPYVIGLD